MFHLENIGDTNMIDNYRDLPIGMYQEICEIDRRTDLEEIARQVSILSILTGKTEEEIYGMPIAEYREIAHKSSFLLHPYEDEILTAKSYKIGAWNLIPVEDYRKITTAQYIDFQTFAADPEKNIVPLLSVMLVPKGKKYNQDYDVMEVQKAIAEHLSVADALSLLAFFFVQFRQSIKDSLIFSREMAMKLRDPEKKKRTLRAIQKEEDRLSKLGVG